MVYWSLLRRNQLREAANRDLLEEGCGKVLVVWEFESKDSAVEKSVRRLFNT
jgi:G:T-mismatch repair DNA endonuclease (very short patch repair protein)